jgi:hypothetical protein
MDDIMHEAPARTTLADLRDTLEDPPLTQHDLPTLEGLTDEIAARLHGVRGNMSDDEFEDMVRGIAETKLHFLTLERDRVLRRSSASRRPSLAQAIGAIPKLPRPPRSCPAPAEESELRL